MKNLLLIDGHSLIHRAYHAYPKTLSTRSGEQTNAVYGFTNILLGAIRDLAPSHIAVSFDLPAPTFRHKLSKDYKKSRVKPDDELIDQIPRVKEIVAALNIPIFEIEGYEADDVIGTLAEQAAADASSRTIILTSDRDLMQLINDKKVVVHYPGRRNNPAKTWNQKDFTAQYQFPPALMVDFKALAGDPSDDIPGVKGIGKVTAQKLISAFGQLDNIYRQLDRIKENLSEKVAEKLIGGREAARMSKKLALINRHVPIKLDWGATAIHEYDKSAVMKLFDELQFESIINKLPNDLFEQEVQEALF